ARLAERVLLRWRIGPSGGEVGNARAVSERPDPLRPFDAKERVRGDAAALVHGEAERPEQRVGLDARRPDERLGVELRAVGEDGVAALDRLQPRLDVDLDAASGELLRRVLAEPRR